MPEISIDGVSANYQVVGRGPRVLVVHASSSSSRQWKSLSESLSNEFEVVAPDLLGCGSSPPFPGTPRAAEQADVRLVRELARQTGAPVHMVGHSYGGRLAAGVTFPGDVAVASLILIEPTMFQLLPEANEDRAWDEVKRLANGVIDACARGDTWTAADLFISYWVGPGALEKFPERVKAETVKGIAVVADSWRAVLDLKGQPSLFDYANIKVPTLLIEGSRSTYAIGRVAALLRGAIPKCYSYTVEGAGHMSPVTHSTVVNSRIAEHIHAHCF